MSEPRYGNTGATLRLTFPFKNLAPNLPTDDRINDGLNDRIKLSALDQQILMTLGQDPFVTVPELIQKTQNSTSTVNRSLKKLQETGRLERIGARKTGHWQVLK